MTMVDAQEARRLASSEGPLDYQAVGFRCGLEIHQQLDTRKLFSPCPSDVIDPDAVKARTVAYYDRRLRATQSELGESDPAALAEAKKRKAFRYLAIDGLTSLVELDEEPPHSMSTDALDVALTFAGLVAARPADEVHIMRKTVIDGSNTSGFQRTALVATGGTVEPDEGGAVGIWTIALEEDSARKVEEGWVQPRGEGSAGLRGVATDDAGQVVTYTLDRLGVPLIEVATAPDITDPKHAQATAARLGALLRATGRVKRGLGSIRQDLNVSIAVGDRVEIKGCQDLRAVPRVIEQEVRRQLWLHFVAESLRERGFDGDEVAEPADVTKGFADCTSKVVRSSLQGGGKVMALALPKWAGLIAGATKDGPRYGREFADHAKAAAGVRGVFHSDEMPAYGIEQAEVDAVRAALKLAADDAFVLCVEKKAVAIRALEAVADCAKDALRGAGRAVRAAQGDDSTRYMRPLPGAARMYPETDVPPIRIPATQWKEVLGRLPASPEERVAAIVDAHGLSADIAGQLVRDGRDERFLDIVAKGAEPSLTARILVQFLPGLEHPERVEEAVPDLVKAVGDGRFAKEAIEAVLKAMHEAPQAGLDGAIEAAGAAAVGESAVDAVIQKVLTARMDFIKERGMAAMGPLMGPVMAELRGKADGALINERLKAALEEVLA